MTILSNPYTLPQDYLDRSSPQYPLNFLDSSLSTSKSYVRIGAVSYLNSKPLIHGLGDVLGSHGCLCTDLPSRLADQLSAGKIDIGLIPVFEFFRNPRFRLVSNSAIVSKGRVWSVRLFFRCNPREVKRVAMDEGSRTSVALSKVLLHEIHGLQPETFPLRMDDDPASVDADAVLIIGDRAMHPERYLDQFVENWDLGETWRELTGLPFVFAAWVSADPSIEYDRLARLLDSTRLRGIQAIPQIAERFANDYALTKDQCVEYLTDFIFFELDEPAKQGLDEFRRRCHHLGLIETRDL